VLLSVRLLRRLHKRSPTGLRWTVAEIGVSLIGIIGAILLVLPAYHGRTVPDVAIDLAMPLGPGRYLVINGGATPAINAHFYTLDQESAADFRGQSYAIDIIGNNRVGLRAPGISPADPTKYIIYGHDVLAPCAGTVLATVDGVPDNDVPEMNRNSMTGNSVILDCDGLAVVLAHFIPGSINVSEADQIVSRQQIAFVGNSGNSGEPHLHMHVQTIGSPETPIAGEPLWLTINGHFPVRNSRFVVEN
jgi:murein DD-endopeptidase MepM/ murein hydrolase activator NlpD